MDPEQRLENIVRKYFRVPLNSELEKHFKHANSRWRIPVSSSGKKNLRGVEIKGNIAYSLDRVCSITDKRKSYFVNLTKKELMSYFSIKREILIPGYEIMRMDAQPDEITNYTAEMIAQKYGLSRGTTEAFKPRLLKDNSIGEIKGSSLLKLYRAVAEFRQGYSGEIPEQYYGNFKRENGKPLNGDPIKAKERLPQDKTKGIDWIVYTLADKFNYHDHRTYFVMLLATENPDGIGMIYVIPQTGYEVKELKEAFVDFFSRWHGASEAHFFKNDVPTTKDRTSTWYIGGMYTSRKNELREAIKKLGIHVHGDSEKLSKARRRADKNLEIVSQAVTYLRSPGRLRDTEKDLGTHTQNPFLPLLYNVAALYRKNQERVVKE